MHWEDPEGWGGEGGGGGSGWGIHVNPWLIHVNVWQKPLQYYKVISLQLIKINEKKNDLPIQDLLCFYVYCAIFCSGSMKNDISDLMGITLNP